MPQSPFQLQVGAYTTRAELAAAYGCATQGGIIASKRSNRVFIFTDHGEKNQFGYLYDGFSDDGTVLFYTGAGQDGDQSEARQNSSILTHAEKGRAVHAFVADGVVGNTQTKWQRYLGEFILDTTKPFERRPAPARDGSTRTVIVFRLLPISSVSEFLLSKVGFTDIKHGVDSREVPIEISSDYFFETAGRGGGSVVRRESQLVDDFVTSMRGHEFMRWSINLPDERAPLLTDVYDKTDGALYEAKAGSSRADLRLAVGQLYDYKRHVPVEGLHCSILLPERPSTDLRDFVETAGLGLVFKDGDRFDFDLAAPIVSN